MTNFAPNVTQRMKFGYKAAGLNHVNQLRTARGTVVSSSANAMRAAVSGVYLSLASLLSDDFAFTSASFAVEDDDVFTPGFTLPAAVTGLTAIADFSPMAKATATTFHGSGNGSKVSLELYGIFWDLSDPAGVAGNGRVEAGELAAVATAIATLAAASALVSIANGPINWYPYVTVKPNDFWVKEVRKLFP